MQQRLSRQQFLEVAIGTAGLSLAAARRDDAAPQAAPPRGAATGEADGFVLRDAIVLTVDAERRCYRSGYVWMRAGRIHAVGPTSDMRRSNSRVPASVTW